MNRFLRDGKRDKNEQPEQQNSAQAATNLDNEDGGGDDGGGGGGGGGRDEMQTPNVAVKDLNLDAVAKANTEYQKKKQKSDQTDKGAAAKAIDIKTLKDDNDVEEASNSKKCKFLCK